RAWPTRASDSPERRPTHALAGRRFPSSVNLKTIDPFQKPEVALPLRLIVGMPNIFPNSTSEFCAERSSAISLKGLGVHFDLAPQPAYEPGVGRMEVEDTQVRRSRVGEAVASPGRRGQERARTGSPHLGPDHEVDLTGEDVERVDVIGVRMRVDALEIGAEGHLDHRELGQLGLDAVESVLVLDRFACARGLNDRLFERSASALRRIELIEMLVVTAAEDVAEAHARRVDVEEDRGRVARVLEGMHDVRRRARECLRPACDPRDLGTEPEVDLALEDI